MQLKVKDPLWRLKIRYGKIATSGNLKNLWSYSYIYISVHKIHFGSSKYFTTNGSVSTPLAFPMDKSLDISVFSFRLFSALQFYILLKRAFLHKINIKPNFTNFTQFYPTFRFRNFQTSSNFSKLQTCSIDKGSFWKTNWHIEAIKFCFWEERKLWKNNAIQWGQYFLL